MASWPFIVKERRRLPRKASLDLFSLIVLDSNRCTTTMVKECGYTRPLFSLEKRLLSNFKAAQCRHLAKYLIEKFSIVTLRLFAIFYRHIKGGNPVGAGFIPSLVGISWKNRCRPILVQGLRADFWNKLTIFKHLNKNVSLAQLEGDCGSGCPRFKSWLGRIFFS